MLKPVVPPEMLPSKQCPSCVIVWVYLPVEAAFLYRRLHRTRCRMHPLSTVSACCRCVVLHVSAMMSSSLWAVIYAYVSIACSSYVHIADDCIGWDIYRSNVVLGSQYSRLSVGWHEMLAGGVCHPVWITAIYDNSGLLFSTPYAVYGQCAGQCSVSARVSCC